MHLGAKYMKKRFNQQATVHQLASVPRFASHTKLMDTASSGIENRCIKA